MEPPAPIRTASSTNWLVQPAPRSTSWACAEARYRVRGYFDLDGGWRDQGGLCLGRLRFPEAPGQAPEGDERHAASSISDLDKAALAKLAQASMDEIAEFSDGLQVRRRPSVPSNSKSNQDQQRAGTAIPPLRCSDCMATRQTCSKWKPSMYCDGFISLLRPLRPAVQGLWHCAAGVIGHSKPSCLHEARCGKFQSSAGGGHLRLSQHSVGQGSGPALRGHGGLRRDPGERARRGRLHHPVDLVPHERPPDGASDHHGCAARARPAASRR